MANIHDPNTWGAFDDRTKVILARIKEIFIDSQDLCGNCNERICTCGEEF